MVKVNLLPPKERTKKQVIKENITAVFLSILALAIISGFSFSLIMFDNSFKEQTKTVEHDIAIQKEKNNKFKEIEDLVANLNKNVLRIKEFQKKNLKWSEILIDIKNRTPINIELTELSAVAPSQAKDKGTAQVSALVIKGLSGNQYDIMKLKEALSASKFYEYVDFESSTLQQEKGKYIFSLKIKLKI